MREPAVIVPFKAAEQKSRLSGVLDPSERRRLSLLMLKSVLAAVKKAGLGASCYVVSSDRSALAMVREAGGKAVFEAGDRGVNEAVALGMKRTRSRLCMIIPADLPLLGAADLELSTRLMDMRADVVISPSRQMDGTNLLLFSRDKPVPLSYDRNSFWNHLGSCSRLGYSVAVYTGRGAVFDVDTAGDLRLLAGMPKRTAAVEMARRAIRSWARS